MNGDCYLVSYPKSGNTWLRILLANLISDDPVPRPLDDLGLPEVPVHRRGCFDDVMGLDSSDLTAAEIRRLLPGFLERLSCRYAGSRGHLFKLHHANRADDDSELLPPGGDHKVVYLVRNPLSVAVSLARHLNVTPAQAVASMGDEGFHFARDPEHLSRTVPQWLGSWSSHVLGWLDAATVRPMVVRYEDLWADTESTLARVADFLGLGDRLHRVPLAVAFSRLDRLRRAEEAAGFREKPRAMQRFFGQGGEGDARAVLSESLAASLVERHGPVMTRLGYLAEVFPAAAKGAVS